MLLAQPDLDANFVLQSLLLAAVLTSIWANLRKDTKREVTINPTIATKADLAELSAKVAENQKSSEVSRGRLYSHVDDLRSDLTDQGNSVRLELTTKMDNQYKELNQRLDDVPGRVISVLRDTGAIKPH